MARHSVCLSSGILPPCPRQHASFANKDGAAAGIGLGQVVHEDANGHPATCAWLALPCKALVNCPGSACCRDRCHSSCCASKKKGAGAWWRAACLARRVASLFLLVARAAAVRIAAGVGLTQRAVGRVGGRHGLVGRHGHCALAEEGSQHEEVGLEHRLVGADDEEAAVACTAQDRTSAAALFPCSSLTYHHNAT